jgi:hypothetical protein
MKYATSYFKGKSWNEEISRTETVFCAELFFFWKKEENLIDFIDRFKLVPGNYDVGYEVSFYRDFLKDEIEFEGEYKLKRTFDLALFSEKDIYIIEAKAQQGFYTKQLNIFKEDKSNILKMLREVDNKIDVNIHLLAIKSSLYNPKNETNDHFEQIITWREIYDLYHVPIFNHADEIYNDRDIRNKLD